MPRGRSSSSSSIGAKRRSGRPLPSRGRKRSSSSRDSRPSPPRRPGPPRRRSPPRRPKSPPRAIRKKSISSSSNSAHSSSVSSSSRSRSSSHSSSDSSSRSRSPVRKIEKAKARSPLRSKVTPKKTERNKSPRKMAPRVDLKNRDRERSRSPLIKPKVVDKPGRRSPASRFHNRRSRSRSDPRKQAPRRLDRQSPRNRVNEPKKIEQSMKDIRIEREFSVEKTPILHVTQISRNVNEKHLLEIFQVYGKISNIEIPFMEGFEIPKGYARIQFEKIENAKKAKEHMDGGQIDGQVIMVEMMANGSINRKRSVSIEKNRNKRISKSISSVRRRISSSPVNKRR